MTAKQEVLKLMPGATIRFITNTKWYVWDERNVRISEGATPEKAWENALPYARSRAKVSA